ncbi:tetratricopeptide repeat protein [Paraliomyxa miuraensis]|uniref:serine/threonine-protein kinase n=1 Tax=Paraliomyxa miuraensis TaxID=376150 RepID=UPI002255ADAF|nr:serine/threonine-protein kinase [Paraliomyxa miuraensis]MCX4244437.1 serine/threonine-protein kinase [Paraliomyxa miuraensis]
MPRSEPPHSTREQITRVMDTRLSTTRSVPTRPRRLRPANPEIPERIGRFRPLAILGRGGMGVVYRAEDPSLGRIVAIKLLTRQREDLDAQQRLRREAEALAQLSHPNVVQIFDGGVFRGQVYIAMELVAGQSLRAWVRHGNPPLEAIVDAYVQAGLGLAAAHGRGIIHRDFKPDNAIMGDDGRVRVVDFGLARADESMGSRAVRSPVPGPVDSERSTGSFHSMLDLPLTASGAVMGTPVYMAPELHQGLSASPSSDQFALCVSLFEAVFGRRPFDGTRLQELVGRMLRFEPTTEPSDAAVPPRLREVVLRGLLPDPAQRWPSMDALLSEIRRAVAPPWWRRLGPTVVLSLSVAAGGVALVTASSGAPCVDAHDALAGAWDDARRAAVRDNLLRTPAPYATQTWTRVETRLDDYAERWVDTHRFACAGTREGGALDLHMACLQRRRRELTAAVDVLAEPGQDVLMRASSLVDGLLEVDDCLDPTAADEVTLPPPRDAAQARAVEGVRERLARSAALHTAGKFTEAAREAREASTAADALDYAPLSAEAALRDGASRNSLGEPSQAIAPLERAYFTAMELGYDDLAGQAAALLVNVTGVGQGDLPTAARWAEHALAVTEGRHERVRASALFGLGMVYFEQQQGERARPLFEETLAIQERLLPPNDGRIAATLNRLGMVLDELDEPERALELQERALALWEQSVGPRHPYLAAGYQYRAIARQNLEQYDRALSDLRRALAIWEQALGPEHPEVGGALANLGVLLRDMDRTPEAIEHYRRALSIWERTIGSEHPRVASVHLNLGHALADQGDRAGAIAEFRRALELRERALGPEHPTTLIARQALQEQRTRGPEPSSTPSPEANAPPTDVLPPGPPGAPR